MSLAALTQDFLSDYTCLREQNKDSELPLGTGLIQGFQPSRGVKSAFKLPRRRDQEVTQAAF
ncbi:hypothetical protein D4764_01G0006310 [Takifugu flavidus]|uniref:Uncharacterized protein n=1 Tax=Takifugu flavidus TaxID=433684 RepID=A0A5C6PPL9_9TELE|nr:hypothetical protein D4764_01G0006310 [Takifugu flavidus]